MLDQQSNEDFALMRMALNRALTRTRYLAAGMSVFLGCFIVYGLLGSGYL